MVSRGFSQTAGLGVQHACGTNSRVNGTNWIILHPSHDAITHFSPIVCSATCALAAGIIASVLLSRFTNVAAISGLVITLPSALCARYAGTAALAPATAAAGCRTVVRDRKSVVE